MKFFSRYLLGTGILILCLVLVSGILTAQTSDDRYAPILASKPDSKSNFGRFATDFLTYPFELLRWPIGKGFVFFDEHRLMDKGQWLFEKSVDYGVTPGFDRADFDLLRILRLKDNLPDTTLESWVHWWPDEYFVAGGKAGLERIANLPLRASAFLNYENRPEEHFYGIGPGSTLGNNTAYRLEQTTFEGVFGYSQTPAFSADIFAGYKRANISNGRDGGAGRFDTYFNGIQSIPGMESDEIFSSGLRLVRDTRNKKENSTKGYLRKLEFSFNEGLYSSRARYFYYEAEAIHYFRLWSERRVFVTHLYAEHHNETSHHEVPFHQMAKLGGFGNSVYSSQTLRGYNRNRFFDNSMALLNLEYRYTVYEYRDWKIDALFFYDQGQVFNHFGKFRWDDFRETYGGGFRVNLLNNTLLTIQIGHGDEGTQLYVKSRSPF